MRLEKVLNICCDAEEMVALFMADIMRCKKKGDTLLSASQQMFFILSDLYIGFHV